jgi:hypothetical protein
MPAELYFAANAPMIEVIITMNAMTFRTGDPWSAAIAMENSPLQLCWPYLSPELALPCKNSYNDS